MVLIILVSCVSEPPRDYPTDELLPGETSVSSLEPSTDVNFLEFSVFYSACGCEAPEGYRFVQGVFLNTSLSFEAHTGAIEFPEPAIIYIDNGEYRVVSGLTAVFGDDCRLVPQLGTFYVPTKYLPAQAFE